MSPTLILLNDGFYFIIPWSDLESGFFAFLIRLHFLLFVWHVAAWFWMTFFYVKWI